ncbi:MAG: hypothetical protein KJ879_02655 [Nanoarchaeota archaeon]|nr:hypothetical protein [Nanoarchaeota archaeon]
MGRKSLIIFLGILVLLIIFFGFWSSNQESEIINKSQCLPNWCFDSLNWSECAQVGGRQTDSYLCVNPVKIPGPFDISIIGDGDCIKKTNQALDLLKEKSPSDYVYVTNYIHTIECPEDIYSINSGLGGIKIQYPPRFYFNKGEEGYYNSEQDTIWFASAFVHEACHSNLYYNYFFENQEVYTDSQVPMEAYSLEYGEHYCQDVQYEILKKLGAEGYNFDHFHDVDNWW